MADDMAEEVLEVVRDDTDFTEAGQEEKWPMLEHLLVHIAENAKFYKNRAYVPEEYDIY
ncbi:hypothetical protein ACFSQ7_39925 [Paenibacillus rhizoplanae]